MKCVARRDLRNGKLIYETNSRFLGKKAFVSKDTLNKIFDYCRNNKECFLFTGVEGEITIVKSINNFNTEATINVSFNLYEIMIKISNNNDYIMYVIPYESYDMWNNCTNGNIIVFRKEERAVFNIEDF